MGCQGSQVKPLWCLLQLSKGLSAALCPTKGSIWVLLEQALDIQWYSLGGIPSGLLMAELVPGFITSQS